jgi:hypothetical protein
MNIDGYLKKHGISFDEAGKQLNMRAEALRAYSSKARYANPEIQEIIIEWSNGEILKESFKEAYRYTGHIVSEPKGETPKSSDLVSFMLNTFGSRVRRVGGSYALDGKPIQTKELYQALQDMLKKDGSDMVIQYPGVVRR